MTAAIAVSIVTIAKDLTNLFSIRSFLNIFFNLLLLGSVVENSFLQAAFPLCAKGGYSKHHVKNHPAMPSGATKPAA